MRADITISLGDEHGLSCLTVAHDDIAPRPPDGPLGHVVVAGDLCWTPRPGVLDPSELDVTPWSGFVPLPGCPGPQHRQPRGGDHRPHAADREVRRPRAQRPVVRGSRPRRRVRRGGARQQPRRRLRPAGRDRHPRQLPRCRLLTVGAGADREAAEAPLQLELNGLRIAFIAATEGNFGSAGPARAGVAALRSGRAQTAVARLSGSVDATIVLLHAGPENYPLPSPRLVDLCRSFADAGQAP